MIDLTGPQVDVITRTKNRPELLERAMTSVLGQTFRHWHHVIVNDGGERDPLELLAGRFAQAYDGRLTLIHVPASVGMAAAANLGVESSSANILSMHDDDDSWHPAFLQVCVDAWQRERRRFPSVRAVVAHANLITERMDGGRIIPLSIAPYGEKLDAGILSLDRLLFANPIPVNALLFEREIWREVGRFREDLPVLDDWDFNIRYVLHSDIWVLPDVLANYHYRPAEAGRLANTVTAGRETHLVYRQLLKNEWLRKDLREGRFGLGAYANLRGHIEELLVKTQPFNSLRALARRLRKNGE